MSPAEIHVLTSMPHNVNGKPDRCALRQQFSTPA
jgi:hypothetical protein